MDQLIRIERLSEHPFSPTLASVGTALGALVDWVVGAGWLSLFGSALPALSALLVGFVGTIFWILYRRYLGLLAASAKRKESHERQAYEVFRESLGEGMLAARLYTRWLTIFLDRTDRFLGDAGMANRTLFPRAFGLQTPAPLWTAPAFDRCLLIAAIYPLTSIFFFWTISGHVGPAETVLRLKADLPGWRRGLEIIAIAIEAFSIWRSIRSTGWQSIAWAVGGGGIAISVAIALAGALEVATAFGIATFLAWVLALALSKTRLINLSNAIHGVSAISGIIVGAIVGGFVGVPNFNLAAAAAGVVAVLVIGFTEAANTASIQFNKQGPFLSILLLIWICFCIGATPALSPLSTWSKVGPMLLFVVLLPLVNAPFDWLSVGLTRALLRRGLECGGWWPLICALGDAILAALLIVSLALVMVIGVQAFNLAAAVGGGKPVLPLRGLFDGIAMQPSSPEFWWVYALLISTLLPSLANLMIGGASLMRGLPRIPSILLKFMPAGKPVLQVDRVWIALVLACQVVFGGILGVALQVGLAAALVLYTMPWLGLGLLEMSKAVAEADLPLRVWHLFERRF